MTNVVQLFQEAAFEPEMTELMGDTYERATRSSGDLTDPIREIIAKRVIDAVRRGIRDPRELCLEATRGLNLQGACD